MKYIDGDITLAKEPYILHGCNCQGVMGSGVAKAIREKFPDAYRAYKDQEKNFGLELGQFSISRAKFPHIVNLLTQENYGSDGNVYASPLAIERSIERLLNSLPRIRGKYHFAIPEIGCGLGGLSWRKDVRPILEELENHRSVEFTVYRI